MSGKGTITAMLGLGLMLAHYKTNPDGAVIKNAISNVNGGPDPAKAHAALLRFFGILGGVVVASIAAGANDDLGTGIIAFFILLWVIWGMSNIKTLKGSNISNYYQVQPAK